MANPFDQFDKQGNPFDKFDGPVTAALAPKPPATGGVSPGVDALRSLPGGLAKGVAGLAGLPGDAVKFLGQTVPEYAIRQFAPETADKLHAVNQLMPEAMPTSASFNEGLSAPFGL
jgi:hypothetical protein